MYKCMIVKGLAINKEALKIEWENIKIRYL